MSVPRTLPPETGRVLGPSETVMWILDAVCPVNAVVIEEIEGPVTQDRLREALDRVQEAHPLLRMRIVRERRRFRFSPGGVPPIPLQWTEAPPDAVHELAEAEFNHPVRPVAGPLLRCRAVIHGQSRCTLILTVNHAILDGLSSYRLAQEICARLGGVSSPAVHPLVPPLENLLPEPLRGVRGALLYLLLLFRLAGRMLRYGRPDRLTGSCTAKPHERRFGFVRFETDPGFSQNLLTAARRRGITVHGLASAALLETLRDYRTPDGKSPLVCASLTDLRTRLALEDKTSVGLFVSTLPTFHSMQSGGGFDELAADISREVRAGKRRGDDLLLGAFSNRWLSRLGRWLWWNRPDRFAEFIERANFGSAGISNLGVLAGEDRWGPVRLRAFNAVVAPSVFNPVLVTTGTIFGRFVVNVIYAAPFFSRGDAASIAGGMVRRLREAAEAPETSK